MRGDTSVQPFVATLSLEPNEAELDNSVAKLSIVGEVVLDNVCTKDDVSRVIELAERRWLRVDGVTDADVAATLLNKGVTKLILDEKTVAEETWVSELPRDRIVAKLPYTKTSPAFVNRINRCGQTASAVQVVVTEAISSDVMEDIVALKNSLDAAVELMVAVTDIAPSSFNDLVVLDKAGVEIQLPGAVLLQDDNLADCLCCLLATDRPDGLFSTIVVDEGQKLLGMAYSSKNSIQVAIKRQRGVYQSRRRGLWIKGDTSGNHQDLLKIMVDCDRDAVVFVVRQHGDGFCHRSMNSCFGKSSGLTLLSETLQSRFENAPEGSYTKRLFMDAGMLKSKLTEEAIELAEAKEKDHVAAEAADLLYLAMTACTRAGVSIRDVEDILDRRHLKIKRRPGNVKPEFVAQHTGQAISETAVLRRIKAEEVPPLHRDPVDPKARQIAEEIMGDIRENGESALLKTAIRLGDIQEGEKHILTRVDLKDYYDNLPDAQRAVLQRTADRIKAFAEAQRDSVAANTTIKIAGGEAGQEVAPVEVAGCYAPGGRYPLPSSVLMGAVTARVAGVKTVWVASPRPKPVVCAAAYIAGCDGLLRVGGAQAIGAFAYGAGDVPICDAIVGPGNMFVTAAKSLVAGAVAIDMLAGPSECLVIADDSAKPAVVAADLLAQSEHDVAARAILVSTSKEMISAVDREVQLQLATLPTADTASVAIEKNSFAVLVKNLDEAADISNRIAPEHLEVHTSDPEKLCSKLDHFGALFVGHHAAEVLGDYGAGPNHTLPTGGTARSYGGLSVHTFMRPRTWLRVDDLEKAQIIVQDAVDLALLEGLHGHSRAASMRLPSSYTK